MDEKRVMEFLSEIKKHEDKPRSFRKDLEIQLMDFRLNAIMTSKNNED